MDTKSNTTSAAPAPVDTLVPVLSDRFALTAGHFAIVALFSSVALFASHLPLSHAVTGRHVLVGQEIIDQRSIPAHDPTLALADGMSWKNASWLSDVVLAGVERLGGTVALSAVQTVLMVATLLLLAKLLWSGSRSKLLMFSGLALWCVVAWSSLAILRPALFGGFALITWLALGQIAERQRRQTGGIATWLFVARPALLALWANLDASAWIGALLAVAEAGAALVQSFLSTRSLRAMGEDRSVRRQLWSVEAALAATLLQPQGLGLWTDWLQFGRSSVWAQWGGVHPLMVTSALGLVMVFLALLTALLLRHSPRSFTAGDVATLGVLALAAAIQVDWVVWSVAGILVVLAPHGAEWISQFRPQANAAPTPAKTEPTDAEPSPLKFVYSLLSLLVVWMAFAFSPLATPLLGGKERTAERTFDRGTPWSASRFFTEQAPQGLVFAPTDWSDWLQWEGPTGLQVAWNSNVAALPPRVAAELRDAARADGNWTRTLDRYGVRWLVVDRSRQERLADAALSQGDDWSVRFEDERMLILKRKEVGG